MGGEDGIYYKNHKRNDAVCCMGLTIWRNSTFLSASSCDGEFLSEKWNQ